MTTAHRYGSITLVCLVVANMIGAGVYTTSGFTLATFSSNAEMVIAAWIAGGIIALSGAYSYGKLICVMPESGGEYFFLSRAAHPSLGYIAGWVSLIAGFTGAIAFAAAAMESYLRPENSAIPPDLIAISAIILAGCAHGFHPKLGSSLQNVFVALKIFLLLAFIGFALTQVSEKAPSISPGTTMPSLSTFAGALVWISLSYAGFNAAVYIAEETNNPRKTVSRSLLIGTLIVTTLYIVLNFVFVISVRYEGAGKPDIAAIAAEHLGGAGLGAIVRGIIALSLFTSVTSMMLAAPRVYAKMAEDGFLPRPLRRGENHPRFAIAAQCILAMLFVLGSSLRDLLGYLGLTLSLCSALSVSCLFLPSIRRKFTSPLTLIPPAFFVLCTLTSSMFMISNQPGQLAATAGTVVLGGIMYALTKGQNISKPKP